MAYHDSLTKLYNKTHLEKVINSRKPKPQTLLLLNVNNFGYINTAYGFEIGDQLLIEISRILADDFGTENTCRIHADEFAILFDEEIDIETFVFRVQNYFYHTAIEIGTITLNVSFTYGAVYSQTELLQKAALSLKKSKESGINRLYIFNKDEDGLDQEYRELFIKANNLLHNALDEDKFIPYYQGIRNNKTQKIDKFEVLARIEDEGKIISPFVFLEAARLSGLLPEITKIMIDKSFKLMASNDYSFSINITEDDLSRNYLASYLSIKAKEYKIEPKRVILEILEGISSGGKQSHVQQLNELKEKGYSLAIDDFGTEYSNFERVLDLEIDFLKIDAKYIKDIDVNPKSYEIAKAIAFFAKNADIPCIAEFVHNESVQKILEELEVEYSQGYYFSQPQASPIS